MSPELRQLLSRSKFHRGAVNAVAALLPTDDTALDALIGETVREKDQAGFIYITLAALQAERKVDARHLAGGAMMLPSSHLLGVIVWHMQGEVAGPLLQAMAHTMLRPAVEAAGLFLITAWVRAEAGRSLPPGFIPHARMFARRAVSETEVVSYLLAMALQAGDAGLLAVVTERFNQVAEEKVAAVKVEAQGLGDIYLKICRGNVCDLIPAEPSKVLVRGFTMRRAVARVGRNDPCPCGSGRKYKQCCLASDAERLQFSTDVAGKTVEEVQAEPEPHLTLAKVLKADPHELVRWDPRKLKPELREEYFKSLGAFHFLDRATEAFELLGWSDDLKQAWDFIGYCATRAERRDILQRLIKVNPQAPTLAADQPLAAALLLAEDDPAKIIQLLDERAMRVLRGETTDDWVGFAYALLLSKFRSVGIFVARSFIPGLPQQQAAQLFGYLLEARDKLNLPPDDPFGEILDERFRAQDPGDGKEAEALREVQKRLDAKAREVGQLKAALDQVHHEVARRESVRPPAAPAVPTAPAALPAVPAADEPALPEMRRKFEGLKTALKERHNERNELRRELHQAHSDLEVLRQKSAATERGDAAKTESADEENELLLPPEPPTNQPVRIIEFPKAFQESLASLPRAVARGALTMLGRLAAGEPAAFVGVVRLKACQGILRQRIGSDFRLLFRLLPDRVVVVDLIPRQDLVRRIKTLM